MLFRNRNFIYMYSGPCFERPPIGKVKKWSHKAGGLSMEVQ